MKAEKFTTIMDIVSGALTEEQVAQLDNIKGESLCATVEEILADKDQSQSTDTLAELVLGEIWCELP